MRWSEIIREAQRLSYADAREFLADLDTGRGRIAAVMTRNPWLREACQEAARQRLGGEFSVFRAVTLAGAPLRPDGVVSTSLDWQVCWQMLNDAPGVIMRGNQMIMSGPTILHYRITPQAVVAWVPFAIETVKGALSKRLNHSIEGRYGERIKIADVLDQHRNLDEQEIVADLSGIQPVGRLSFETNLRGRERAHLFRAFMSGKTDLVAAARTMRIDYWDEESLRGMQEEFAAFRNG